MKWLFNKCQRYEASLCLLAAGELPEAERVRVMAHFAKCDACRAKFAELQNLARGLTEAGRRLPQVEAPASLRRRWMTAVRASAREEVGRGVLTAPGVEGAERGALGTARPTGGIIFGWLSGRRLAWGSVAAMWALVLFFRFSAPDGPKPASMASAPPVSLREVLLALKVEASPAQFRADAGRPPPQLPPLDALPPRSQFAPAVSSDLEVA